MDIKPSKSDEVTTSLWDGDSYFALTYAGNETHQGYKFVEFDFEKLKISTSGILAEILEGLPPAVRYHQILSFRRIITKINSNSAVSSILTTPASDVTEDDIRMLWRSADNELKGAANPRHEFLNFRKVFDLSEIVINNEVFLKHVPYRTIFVRKNESASPEEKKTAVGDQGAPSDKDSGALEVKPSNKPDKYTPNYWEDDTYCISGIQSANGTHRYSSHKFNFKNLGISKGGLLAEILQTLPSPFSTPIMYDFQKVIRGLSKLSEFSNILSTPAQELHERDIINLWLGMESVILGFANRTRLRDMFHRCRTTFESGAVTLADGLSLDGVLFETTLPQSQETSKGLISDSFDENIEDRILAEPVTTPLESGMDLGERILKHLNGRIEFIKNAFKLYIIKCLILAELITEKKEEGLPGFLSPLLSRLIRDGYPARQAIRSMTPEQRFHIYCYRLAKNHTANIDRTQEVIIKGFLPIEELNLSGPSGGHTWMLSDRLLTGETLLAIAVILKIETVWNNEPLLSLDSSRVIKTAFGYILSGIKSKTGDIVPDHEIKTSRDYDRLNDRERLSLYPARFCVELLLRNLNSISKNFGIREKNLFLAPQAKANENLHFRVIPIKGNLTRLCNRVGVAPFSLKQLRDQVANQIYFRDGKNILHLMILLGHKNISATAQYVNTGIIELECEANSNRFTQILEQSILFVSGREMDVSLPEHVLAQARTLLFPVSDFADEAETCLLSMWLKSHATMKLIIDEDSVALCALQRKYYLNYAMELASRDPVRFRDSHLPLIIICTALHRIISKSRFGLLLREYDARYLNSRL